MRRVGKRRRWLLSLVALGLVASGALSGCSNSEDFSVIPGPVPASPAAARVSGTLARSPSGAYALLDAPLPPGFAPVVGATVTVVGQSGPQAITDAQGVLSLPSEQNRARLLITLPGAPSTVIEAPAFSEQAGPAVTLEHFPSRFQLRDTDLVASRVVGVDSEGRYSVVKATFRQGDTTTAPEEPLTSELATRRLKAAVLEQSAGASGPVVDGKPGTRELSASSGAASGSADVSGYSTICQAALSGQVLDQGVPLAGAVVSVEGSTQTATTDANGNYSFTGLAPLPSQVQVVHNNELVALGFAPLTSMMQTQLDIPTRPTHWKTSFTLPVALATGIGTRLNGQVFTCDGTSLREFTDNGTEVTAPTPVAPATLTDPVAVAADCGGEAYVADNAQGQILQFNGKTTVCTVPSPIAVAVDGGDNIYALSSSQAGLQFLANSTGSAWAEAVTVGADILSNPLALAVSRDGRIYVADTGNDRIAVLELFQGTPGRLLRGDPDLGSLEEVQARLVGQWKITAPLGVALGPSGEVYTSSAAGVVCTDSNGSEPITVTTTPALGPIAIAPQGRVLIAEADGVHTYTTDTLAVLPQTPPTPTGQTVLDATTIASLDANLQQVMSNFELPGATLTVSVNGQQVISRGYGYSELSSTARTVTQPDQLFRLASCSKVFTSAGALLQMQDYPDTLQMDTLPFVEGGLLHGGVPGYDLGAKYADDNQPKISLAFLLRMTAGLNTTSGLYAPLAGTLGYPNPPATSIQILEHIYANFKLGFEPGAQYVYSDVAYMTLGRVVEAVAQLKVGPSATYGSYIQQRLFPAVGITDMQIQSTQVGGAKPNEVTYYPYSGQACGQSIFTSSPDQVPVTYGASYDGLAHDSTGGWIATSADLVQMANSLAPNGTPPGFTNPLSAANQALFSAPPTFPNANPLAYFGCGWNFTADSSGKVLTMSKDGALPGTITWVKYFQQGSQANPDTVVYAFVINSRPGPGSKKSDDAKMQFQAQVENFLAAQAGNWPSSNK